MAGLLVQSALKYLLGFGTVSPYLGYSALTDFFPTMTLRPNPTCTNAACLARQAWPHPPQTTPFTVHHRHCCSSMLLLSPSPAEQKEYMASKPERDASAAAASAEIAQLQELAAAVPLHAENEWRIRYKWSLKIGL